MIHKTVSMCDSYIKLMLIHHEKNEIVFSVMFKGIKEFFSTFTFLKLNLTALPAL